MEASIGEEVPVGSPPAPAPAPFTGGAPTITLVINTYNQARFLREALDSVVAQTRAPDEVLVIDDSSQDDPATVAARFAGVILHRIPNNGISAARNYATKIAKSELIAFLDADDRLMPRALEAGLEAMAKTPDVAYVCGGHRQVDGAWNPITEDLAAPSPLSYRDLLERNSIAMHATVLYRRDRLLASGGFEEGLHAGEDYDVYMRLARDFPVASYPEVVAEYRKHGQNSSNNAKRMLVCTLKVHARQKAAAAADPELAKAWAVGRSFWTKFYLREIMRERRDGLKILLKKMTPRFLLRMTPRSPTSRIVPGGVRFGDFGRVSPISDDFGYDRGSPIDRGYIEAFLERNAADVRGRVMEIGEDMYSRRYGGAKVTHQDVLHVHADNPQATIVGDLSSKDILPPGVFDCIVLTQTLHCIYDMAAAVNEIYKGLKPGGVVLVTVPGITRIDRGEWGDTNWFWSLTRASATRLFADQFGAENIKVEQFGNAAVAAAFVQGVAIEEMDPAVLAISDPCFPVTLTVRAQKAA